MPLHTSLSSCPGDANHHDCLARRFANVNGSQSRNSRITSRDFSPLAFLVPKRSCVALFLPRTLDDK